MLKTIAFLILFFGALTLITILEGDKETEEVRREKEEKKLILGYCETFERYAVELADQNNLDLLRMGSSFDVLSNLKSGNIDYAVIGRRAYTPEINEQTLEIPLKEYGWTLVSSEKDFFEYSDIKKLEIHTYLDQEEVQGFFSYEPSVIYHDDIDSAFENGITLIHWDDFQDDFQLVVPLQGYAKVEKFRNPMLYMWEDTEPLESLGL